ncbi:hypothetical protein BGZ99_003612, partial [Dissophora globulifera]
GGETATFRVEPPLLSRKRRNPRQHAPRPVKIRRRVEGKAGSSLAAQDGSPVPVTDQEPIDPELAKRRKDSANEVFRSIMETTSVSSTIRLYRAQLKHWK